MTANIIYERIKEQADKQNLSLRQLSIKSGFKSPSAISRYKQGVTPTDTAVKAIAGALGVSVDYLLGNTDEMHSNKKVDKTVDLEKDTTILALDGMELSDDYKQFIIDQVRSLRKLRGDDE
ncbi:helix-turn-helix domain-containing protein [Weissella confusa]|uniref:helix-turn-helix domain-containing protein n=1 Tax=Weissella confusa TaxID=1583 RepID=UPI0018992056|nr:helix-turn-helix transcriptional regulator [Weissella confusa]